MSLHLDEFKTRQRATWDAGDYPTLSERIADVGERVVARAGIEPSMTVLDVACGSGNATIPAALTGARVTGLDLTPRLLETGRAKAEAAGLDVAWVEGDAENLRFGDDSFDRVLSVFGHMFAPRHATVADEMVRVCRSGGAIVTATWTPEGAVGSLFEVTAAYMPPLPEFASPPILWGSEEHVRELFGAVASSFELERHLNVIEYDSLESYADTFMSEFGPMVTAKAMLGERFDEMRAQIVEIWRDANEANDGTLRLPQEYLLSVVRL